MAWPALTAEDVLSGEGAEVIGRDLWDRDLGVMEVGTTYWCDAVNVTGGSWADLVSKTVRCPGWAKSGAVCSLVVSVDAIGSDLRLVVGSITGSTVTPSGASTPTLTATATDDTWADALVVIKVQGQQNTAAANVTGDIVCSLTWEI